MKTTPISTASAAPCAPVAACAAVASRRLRTTALALLAGVVAGCANPGGITSSAQMMDASALGIAGTTQIPPTASSTDVSAVQWPRPDWWRGFKDPTLDTLVQRALADSPDLRLVQARLRKAAAAVQASQAGALPRLDGSVDLTRQHFSANGIYPPPLGGSTLTLASLGLAASWEPDFFGRHHEELQAALGARRSAEAEQQAARMLLATRVVSSYVRLAGLLDQRDVADRALKRRQQMLSLVSERVRAGLDSKVELRQSEEQVPESRQQIQALDEQISATRHALATLAAQPYDALDALAPRLDSLRWISPPERVPADLLGRRADVVAARWRVEASVADLRGARTLFYPNVNLSALLGLGSAGLDRLFRDGSRQWSAGPAIRLPIFDAGRLRANLGAKAADVDAAVESYNTTVLGAVREAADAIASIRSVDEQVETQRAADAAAESAYSLASERYRAGLSTFLVVLTAEGALLRQRQLAAELRARQLDTQVSLVRALGGGFQPGDLAEVSESSLAAAQAMQTAAPDLQATPANSFR